MRIRPRLAFRRRAFGAVGILAVAALALLLVFGWRRSSDAPLATPAGLGQAPVERVAASDPCSPSAEAHIPPAEARRHGATSTPARSGAYLGVWQPGVPEDMAQLDAFTRAVGKSPAIVMFWRDSADDAGTLDLGWLCAIAGRGAVPLISWMPSDWRSDADQSPYSLDSILAGKLDGYFDGWAQQLARYGRPVMLRWAHEMNGNWYPWGRQDGNTPEKYVAAWRHLHDRFVAAGATNVLWVWSPNVVDDGGGNAAAFEPYYPGDAYVDWVGLDGYNSAPSGWRWFRQIFGSSYDRITALTAKPLMIAETASSDALPAQAASGDTKAKWIADALGDAIPHAFPRIQAVVWFNEDKTNVERNGFDWRIASSAEAQRAFAAAVASNYYLSHWP